MVGVGGKKMIAGEKKNGDIRGKNGKGERKTDENYIKNGEKGLKNASFWVINSTRTPQTYSSGEK